MSGEDGKAVPYDAKVINAKLLLQSDPTPTDPTKSGHIKHLTSMTTVGSKIIEAKARDPNRAFCHVVTISEYKPFLKLLEEFAIKSVSDRPLSKHYTEDKRKEAIADCINDFKVYREADKETFDASHDDNFSCSNYNQINADILTMIINRRITDTKTTDTKTTDTKADTKVKYMDVKRGDVIQLAFVGYRSYGKFFYDGTKVIPQADEDSDYYALPKEFTVPSEFSLNYWDDIDFIQYSQHGAFCFDTALSNDLSIDNFKRLEVKYEELTILHTTLNVPNKGKWNIVIITEDEDRTIGTAPEQSSGTKDAFDRFMDDGRCFSLDIIAERYMIGNEFMETLTNNGIDQTTITAANTIVVSA